MTRMIRRDAMHMLAGTGACALLGLSRNELSSDELRSRQDGPALVQGTLTMAHSQGRRLIGFLETGIRGGQVLCSLVRQDEQNPAVQSVFAAPTERNGSFGVEVTVSFFTEPVGDITFSLLHVPAASEGQRV